MIHFSKSCMNSHFPLEQVNFLIKLQYMLPRWPYWPHRHFPNTTFTLTMTPTQS